ncbi:hypothetical protein [Anaerosacchariphilus polymeriproducens]|uniref:Uncharacterized protein n=1 Tax=Anaerosacchariphilus polymeriproducens TaxID=1812858 RepID=A0A371ATQ0_9FIRM|nr:hypothetical protein [Anaerosacchariphilus polymeriproducens]RDU22860.1 hypothetical protein DWV06_12515 [Anaerosacchariphilus polymeriproducens]
MEVLERAIERIKRGIQMAIDVQDERIVEELRITLVALEEKKEKESKQKPIRVKKAKEHQEKAGYKHRCPNCNCAVGYIERKKLYEECCQYCATCGQRLDWSENE